MKSIYRKALALAIPMMIQSGITNAVGLVDNLMVGSLGTESMTAVSIASQLIFVFNLAIFGGLSGPGIYGAQYYGKGNKKGFCDVFRLKYWICILCCVLGIAAFLVGGEFFINLYLHESDAAINMNETLRLGMQYLDIMLWSFPAFVVTQIYAGSLRETGESIKPMVAGIVSVFTDIVFNYLLIFGKCGLPQMGVQGAAVATVIARYVELTVVVIWAHARVDKHDFLKGIYRTLRIPIKNMGNIIKKSIPIFVNEFMWAGGMAALTQCYSTRGLSVVAGINISNAICNLLNVVFIAMGGAVGILTGQMLGASKFEEAKKSSTKLMWFTGGICVILTLVLVSLSGVFPRLYETTEEVRAYGKYFILLTAIFFPVQGFLNALYFTLRSGGKTVITFLFDSVYTWTFSVGVAFCLCKFTGMNVLVIYAIVQALDFVKVGIGYWLIKKGIWIQNLVSE